MKSNPTTIQVTTICDSSNSNISWEYSSDNSSLWNWLNLNQMHSSIKQQCYQSESLTTVFNTRYSWSHWAEQLSKKLNPKAEGN